MNLVRISSFEQYCHLVKKYDRKGRITNDYLQKEAADLIVHDRLSAVSGTDNAFLFVHKDGFCRLYYYINNPEEQLDLPSGELVTEILYRGGIMPETEVQWLQCHGFRKNIIRDQFFAKYSSFTEPRSPIGVTIETAQSLEEVCWAARLFNISFDKWSGDHLSADMLDTMFSNRQILIARDNDGKLLGALHFTIYQNICWLNHVVVLPDARGHNIGRSLLEAYIEAGHINGDNSRYMLWVKRDNTPAIELYRNKGFTRMNKSTLSMVRL